MSQATHLVHPPPARSRRATGILLLIATSVLWSLSGLGVKTAHLEALTFAFYRALGAGLALLIPLWFSKGVRPSPRWMLLSVPIYTCTISFVIVSMSHATAASGILLQYTGPVFCALLAWLIQKRRIGAQTWVAMAIAMTGVAIMVLGAREGTSKQALVVGLASGVSFGAIILVLEKINRVGGGNVNTLMVVCINNLGATLILGALTAAFGSFHASTWGTAVALATGVVQLAIPYVLFQLALKRVSPVDASLLILLEPVLNPLWVWLAVNERPDVATFIGGAAILIAMVVEALKPDDAAVR